MASAANRGRSASGRAVHREFQLFAIPGTVVAVEQFAEFVVKLEIVIEFQQFVKLVKLQQFVQQFQFVAVVQ